MRLFVLSVILVSCCFAMPVWESIGPYGGSFRALATAPSNDDIIYIVQHYPAEVTFRQPRCFRSTDAGDSWFEVGIVSESLYVYSAAVDPTNPDIVYAGSKNIVYKSTDGGATWTGTEVAYDSIMSIAVHPTNPSIVFATGRAEIGQDTIRPSFFKSTDAGLSWDTVSLDTAVGYTYCIAVDPSDNDVIYISGRHKSHLNTRPRIYKSTDGGASFTTVYSDTIRATAYSVCVHPTNSDIVYASRLKKILRSTDAGDSWSEMYDCGSTVYSLATSPADSDVVYAGKDAIVFKSTDAGVSWFETDSGLQGRCIYGLAVKSTDADVVYATNQRLNYENTGFYKTTNGGTDWFASNQGISEARIPGFALAPSSPSIIYTEYYIVSVYKSTNSGDDWTKLPYFACCYITDELAVHNADPDTVLCIEGSG